MQGLESLEGLADARYELAIHGRYGDNMIGHLTPGEMVLPRPVADDPVLKRQLFDAFERHELNPYQYQVGHFENSINPLTGAPEFGFFKKLGKSLKKAAPTIGKIVGFAVGGPAGAAIGGGIGGGIKEGSLKGAVKHAAQGYMLGSAAAGVGASFDALTGLQKVGVAGLGLAGLGGFDDVKDTSRMPGPSGAYGGYLENPLRPAVLPTQYGIEGVGVGSPNYLTSGISSSGMMDPATAAYLRATMGDDEYSKLMFPEFNEGGVMDMRAVGGDIEDPDGAGDVDTVNAILADGEFVMTKQAVTGLGDGDHEAGIKRLYAMMDKNENKAKQMGIGRA